MISINIICTGRLKESFWNEAVLEYSKRIGRYAVFKIIELAQAKLSDKPGRKEIESALESEAKLIKPYCEQKSAYNIAMCIEGRILTSEELSSTLDSLVLNGYSTVNFIVGSSFGLAESVKKLADLKLSMSKMTFPHQLARVMLCEQIYRAMTISANEKYHK